MLLVASYIFYGSWDYRFLSLIFLSTVVDYYCGLKISQTVHPAGRKKYLFLSLFFNLGALGFFKYFNFFVSNLQALFLFAGFRLEGATLNIILPVGISFYTFQTLSYTIDIYYNKLKPEKNFLDFALFVSFFPQLVAGPIERASNLLPQITSRRRITYENIKKGVFFICWGYFLKIFVADNMAIIANQVFRETRIIPGMEALMGIYAFAFQILGDFAGYSFIAVGISELLGITLMTNFLYPYFVTNPSDFWKNWHISLSTWLKDYLYIPLGGNRGGEFLTYRNLFLTMLIGGLWHGAGWTFVLWGLYQGMILIIFRLASELGASGQKRDTPSVLVRSLKAFGMFQITCIGWLIFRADSVAQISKMLSSIFFHMGAPSWPALSYGATILFHTWLLIAVQVIQMKNDNLLIFENIPKPFMQWILLLMFYSIVFWGEFGGQEFIYFQF